MSSIVYYLTGPYQRAPTKANLPVQVAQRGSLAGRALNAIAQGGLTTATALGSLAQGTLKGVGKVANYPSRRYVEYMDPLIGSKKYEISSHIRDHIRPLNLLAESKMYITEKTSIQQLEDFCTSLDQQIEELKDNTFFTAQDPDEFGVLDETQIEEQLALEDQIEPINKLKEQTQILIEKKKELESMRSRNWAPAAGLRRAAQLSLGVYIAATVDINPYLQKLANNFDTPTLIGNKQGQAPANLFDFLVPEPDSALGRISAPIIQEIQGEVSWATESPHLQAIALETARSIEAFIENSNQDEGVLIAFQKLSAASEQLAAFETRAELEQEIELLGNHYTSGAESALKKAQKELAKLDRVIESAYPEETLETAQDSFDFYKVQYETLLLGGEMLEEKISTAQNAALVNLTKFLLKDVPNDINNFLKVFKQVIYWIVFRLVSLVVKDLVHKSVDAKIVEELAASTKTQIEALINHPDYAPYIQASQRKLLPALIESQLKALIPHLLSDIPQRLADYKAIYRDVPMEVADRLMPSNAEAFQDSIQRLTGSVLSKLTQSSAGAQLTGIASLDTKLVNIGRAKASRMLNSTDFSGPTSIIGEKIHKWVGSGPTANHPSP